MIKIISICLIFLSIRAYADSIPTYTKKYCLALNTSSTLKYTDMNAYAYVNIYSKKHDYWVYVNYFNRSESKTVLKDYSCGFFYDYNLTKKLSIWSYYQGGFEKNDNIHQISGGIGYNLLNKNNFHIGINNGFIYRYIITEKNINDYRYNFRVKSEYYTKKFYLQTYTYFQPEFANMNDYDFITWNTFTYRIHNNFNFKVYHWLSWNSIIQQPFQYIILGISIENW